MKEYILDMIESLKELTKISHRLMQAIDAKRKALAKMDISEIEKASNLELEILTEMENIDRKRMEAFEKMKAAIDFKGKVANLKELLEHLQEPYRTEIEEAAQDLKTVLRDAKKLNLINQDLTERSMHHFTSLIKIIKGSAKDIESSAAKGGEKEVGKRNKSFVDQTA